MNKDELLNKIEYMNFTRLLKIRIDIIEQCNRINYLQKTSQKELEDRLIKENTNKEINARIRNIEKLISMVITNSITNTDDAIKLIDYKIIRDLPNVIEKLINGQYNYEWSFKDYYFDYSIIQIDPRIKIAYCQQLELKKVEEQRSDYSIGKQNTSLVKNPIYFDLLYLTSSDKQYLPFLEKIIKNKLYNPNVLDCIPSNNPFYSRIMGLNIPEITLSVIMDPRTDFRNLANGSDELEGMIRNIATQYKDYGIIESSLSLLSNVLINKNVSIIDSNRCANGLDHDLLPYIDYLVSDLEKCDIKEVQDLFTYLVSDEAIEKQLQISKYPSIYRDNAIDIYCNLIEKRRGEEVTGISKLKMLKLY